MNYLVNDARYINFLNRKKKNNLIQANSNSC